MNFLIADEIYFVFGTMITFSQRDATRIKPEQFSEFGSRTTGQCAQKRKKKTTTIWKFLFQIFLPIQA